MNPRRSPYSAVIRLAMFAAVLLLFLPGSGTAQEEGPGWKVRSPFRPLDLATPSTIRTGAGLPGPDYWQQKVDYRIEAAIDSVNRGGIYRYITKPWDENELRMTIENARQLFDLQAILNMRQQPRPHILH